MSIEKVDSPSGSKIIDISVTDVPMDERICANCGLLGYCPSMLKGKLTDLRGHRETPNSCSRWRDQAVMNPHRGPDCAPEDTCIFCDGISCEAKGKRGTNVRCDKIMYDGKRIATVEYAPACLLFDRNQLSNYPKEEKGHVQAGTGELKQAANVAAEEKLVEMVESAMERTVPEAEADGQAADAQADSIPTVPGVESDAVSSSERLQVLAAEIRFLTKLTVENAIAIGQRLNEAKEMVPGSWGVWLQTNVHYSQDTAERFMNIAAEYADSATLRNSGLGVSALCELMALPKPEREEFVNEVHVIDGREKRAEEMSVRELHAAIARRKRREEELETQIWAKSQEINRADIEKSNALNALRDKLNAEHGEAIRKLTEIHGKVVADLKEDLALKREEISGLEKPETVTVEVDKVVAPPDYEAALADALEAVELRKQAEATAAMIRQVMTRPDNMQLLSAGALGTAVDAFLKSVRVFPFSGPAIFSGDKPMRTDIFKVQLDKVGIWLAASYAALEGKILEVAASAQMDE